IFERTIRNADDIDRYDVYRLYETLQMVHFEEMPLSDKLGFLQNRLNFLESSPEPAMVTETAQKLWDDHLNYQIEFIGRMIKQICNTIL
ncbi:MAG: hypothetical protein Q4D46_04320, partial [Erysipelotrichaceae bacterium]|nr:hypothetical protein [Erysipelotrichaceae bacterium]